MDNTLLSDEDRQEESIDGGKFLTFSLKSEDYGIEILKVREIIGIMQITSVPQTLDYLKGVINLRGKVIPVIDLRLKFGLDEVDYGDRTCIIVVNVKSKLMGIIVDTVSEVMEIPSSDIEPPPNLSSKVETGNILGMGKVKGNVMILLDIDKILSSEELVQLQGIVKDEKAE